MKHGTVVSIGTFDGVHLGHQAILQEVRDQAAGRSLSSLAYAFSLPPRWAMNENGEPFLLLPPATKHQILESFVDETCAADFHAVRAMDPREFVETVLIGELHARVIVEGEAFRFARNRSGDLDTLTALGQSHGLDVIRVPPVIIGNAAASSTRIRDAIRRGDISMARSCLGRSPVLCGYVKPGDQLGGELGYPTANLDLDPRILVPPDGIYLVDVHVADVGTRGLLYVGSRPTLDSSERRCEVHLLESPPHSLQGEWLETHLLEKIRDDRAFSSLRALSAQIEADVVEAKRRLTRYPLREQRISS